MRAKIKIIAAMLIWGSMGIFIRNIDLQSAEIALVRGIIGVGFLLIVTFFLKGHISKERLAANKILLIISGIALSANWIFLFEAYKNTTIAIATVSYYMAPIIIVALSPFVLKEKLSILKVICIITAVIGLALVSGVFTSLSPITSNGMGILFGVAAAISYASLTLMNKFIKGLSSMEATIAQLAIAAAVLFLYVILTTNNLEIAAYKQSAVLLIVLGIVHTGLAFWLFFSAVKDLKAQKIAVFSFIDPVTAIVLSALLLNERMMVTQVIGVTLILGATFISEVFGNNNIQ